jgi:hypothetical protein
MSLPPLRHPPDASRARDRGTVGSARIWSAEERAGARKGAPLEPAPVADGAPHVAAMDLQDLERRRPALARRLRGALSKAELASAERGEILTKLLAYVDESAASTPSDAAAAGHANGAEANGKSDDVDARAVDVLERRLTKVRESLRAARDLKRRLSILRDHDPGIASIYRAVQGIADVDALREMKREMLTDIFQANLALQRRPA